MKIPFPTVPKTKAEKSDYAMIEESVLENERKGGFIQVYPSENHVHLYRNFFEEERRNDNILHDYVFNGKYKNMQIDIENDSMAYYGIRGSSKNGNTSTQRSRDAVSLNPSRRRKHEFQPNPFSAKNSEYRRI